MLAALSPDIARLMAFNPAYVLVRNYRQGDAGVFAARLACARMAMTAVRLVIVFLAGHAWFRKLRRSFADLI